MLLMPRTFEIVTLPTPKKAMPQWRYEVTAWLGDMVMCVTVHTTNASMASQVAWLRDRDFENVLQ